MSVHRVDAETPPSLGERCAQAAWLAPGLLFAGAIAVAAYLLEPMTTLATLAAFGKPVTITAPVLGFSRHGAARRRRAAPVCAGNGIFGQERVALGDRAIRSKDRGERIIGLGVGRSRWSSSRWG